MVLDWPALLIAFVGGSLMATVVSAFVRHYIVQPVISVRLDEHRGSYTDVMDVYGVDAQGISSLPHKARYLRLHVENTGLSSIKGCSGFITQMTKHLPGAAQVRSRQEVIDLGWSHHPSDRDIPRSAFFHMDVVSIHQWPGRIGQKWKLNLPRFIPNTLEEFLADKATYVFDVLVAADNAKPRTIRVEFSHDPNSDELKFKPVDKARYPWWAFWRWLKVWFAQR